MAFIVFEGIDASGKSTLMELLSTRLKKRGLPVVETREPGGTVIGWSIRRILLKRNRYFSKESLDPVSETLLFYADRKQHIKKILKPALERGDWVLSDRYWASTSAYQCGARGISEEFVENLRQSVCGDLNPDLWIFLDTPVDVAKKRRYQYGFLRDRIEKEGEGFQRKVRDHYLKIMEKKPWKWLVLDGSKRKEELLEEILKKLEEKRFL